jgi:hypothetical protein
MEVLLKCPALIDASSEQEVQEYLDPFLKAIKFDPESDSEIEVNEVSGDFDEEDIDSDLS